LEINKNTVFTRFYRHGAILGFPRITPWRCLSNVCYNATGAIIQHHGVIGELPRLAPWRCIFTFDFNAKEHDDTGKDSAIKTHRKFTQHRDR